MDCIHIRNWDRLYEVNSSNSAWKPGDRKRSGSLQYVRTPTYGTAWPRTYRHLLKTAERLEQSAAVAMGIFAMLKQVAANHPADMRGYIIDGHCNPYDLDELPDALGFSEKDTIDGLITLMESGWIEISKLPENMAELATEDIEPDFSRISVISGKSGNSKISRISGNSPPNQSNTNQSTSKTYHKNDTTQTASFDDWIYKITNSTNKVGTFMEMIVSLYGEDRKPAGGRLGSLRSRIKDDRRLAQLLWENSTRKPAGDICNFIEAASKVGTKRKPSAKAVNYEEGF